jgi:predicted transcriptional regulator
MTITLTSEVEARLRERAEQTGQDINELALDLLASALEDPDDLSEDAIVEIRQGIRRGLEAAKAGRERSLDSYIADVARRRAMRAEEAA